MKFRNLLSPRMLHALRAFVCRLLALSNCFGTVVPSQFSWGSPLPGKLGLTPLPNRERSLSLWRRCGVRLPAR